MTDIMIEREQPKSVRKYLRMLEEEKRNQRYKELEAESHLNHKPFIHEPVERMEMLRNGRDGVTSLEAGMWFDNNWKEREYGR